MSDVKDEIRKSEISFNADIKKHSIYIDYKDSFGVFVRRLTMFLVLTFTPIAIGVYLQSSAMQWIGFVLAILFIFGFSAALANKTTFDTTDEARRFLDKIDRGEV